MRTNKRLKRVVGLAVAAVIGVGGTAYAATIQGIDVGYDGVVQGSGWGTTWWNGKPHVTGTWADKRSNSYGIYANAVFSQRQYTCNLGNPCRWAWLSYQQVNGPLTSSKVTSYGFNGSTTGKSGYYGAALNVCVDVPWRFDPCNSRGRYGF